MVFQIGTVRESSARELFVQPGVVLSVVDPERGVLGRVRVRRVLRPRVHGPDLDAGPVEVLAEWLDVEGRLSGQLRYLPLVALRPDCGPTLVFGPPRVQ
ncbi:MAG: hypothetical protein KDD82_21395 [Planctomycetes bacterium]|nr:hypothetical protein [Planctomycetota bacterium]